MAALEGVSHCLHLFLVLLCHGSQLACIRFSHSLSDFFLRTDCMQDCSFWRMFLQVNEAFLSHMDRCIIQWVAYMNYADQNYKELCWWERKKQRDAETDQTKKSDARTDGKAEKLTPCRLRNCIIPVWFCKTTSLQMFCESVIFWRLSKEIISVVPGWSLQLQESSERFHSVVKLGDGVRPSVIFLLSEIAEHRERGQFLVTVSSFLSSASLLYSHDGENCFIPNKYQTLTFRPVQEEIARIVLSCTKGIYLSVC